ncbi:hypothetical protein BGZ57DRAFT_766626, partial [Hyaloscypha finlandica]
PCLSALDPNAHWVTAGPPPNGAYPLGIYNMSPWKRKIRVPSVKALAAPINMVVDAMDIIGLKAIVEYSGYATQKSGKPYNNKWICQLIYRSEAERAKLINIREYINTALVREVAEGNRE